MTRFYAARWANLMCNANGIDQLNDIFCRCRRKYEWLGGFEVWKDEFL